jgi:predicted nucleic acid-binding protein
MIEKVFVDTGALIARYLKKDGLHSKAVALWLKVEKAPIQCIISPLIIHEVATLLSRRANPLFAAEKIRSIYLSSRFRILRGDSDLEIEALKIMEKYADLPLSYADAFSIAIMREYNIKRVFTFDEDFTVVGFTPFR